jgi:hypothetical protein
VVINERTRYVLAGIVFAVISGVRARCIALAIALPGITHITLAGARPGAYAHEASRENDKSYGDCPCNELRGESPYHEAPRFQAEAVLRPLSLGPDMEFIIYF